MSEFVRIQRIIVIVIVSGLILVAPTGSVSKEPTVGTEIQLPAADRAFLEQILGKGVVGKSVAGTTISDPLQFFPLKDGTWVYRFTSGKNKGNSVQHVLTKLKRDPSGGSWREAWGPNVVLFFLKTKDGGVEVVSSQDLHQGVVSRYSPREPMLLPKMKPGDTKHMKTDVKVYDLSHPDHLTHKGSLTITFTYLGAYQVRVPAGTFQAPLFKWKYKGKVGPAKVQDIQYRFFAKDVGTVAMIEKTDVTALLVYQQHTKVGKVLLEKK